MSSKEKVTSKIDLCRSPAIFFSCYNHEIVLSSTALLASYCVTVMSLV